MFSSFHRTFKEKDIIGKVIVSVKVRSSVFKIGKGLVVTVFYHLKKHTRLVVSREQILITVETSKLISFLLSI